MKIFRKTLIHGGGFFLLYPQNAKYEGVYAKTHEFILGNIASDKRTKDKDKNVKL